MEFYMDPCINGYHICKEFWSAILGKELFTEKIPYVVDCYAVTMKKDSSDNATSRFKSDPAHFVAKYSSIDIT